LWRMGAVDVHASMKSLVEQTTKIVEVFAPFPHYQQIQAFFRT
jgi:hypothetical protein